jgi:hypothetical protein
MKGAKKNNGRSLRSTDKVRGRTPVTINDEQFQSLAEYEELTGVTIEELLDECLVDYIHAVLSTGVEDLAERAASA